MKIFYKKIISMVLILSVLSGVLIMPASATPGAAVDYVSGQLWDLVKLQDIDTGLLFWKNLLKSYLAPGVTESTATAADWAAAYGGGSSGGGGVGRDGSYLDSINKNYGTSTLTDTGAGIFYPSLWDSGFGKYSGFSPVVPEQFTDFKHSSNSILSFSGYVNGYYQKHFVFLSKPFSVPLTGTYSIVYPSVHFTGAEVIRGSNSGGDPTAIFMLVEGESFSYKQEDFSRSDDLTSFYKGFSRSIALPKGFYRFVVQVPIRTSSGGHFFGFSMPTPYLVLDSVFSTGADVVPATRPGGFGGGSSSGGGAGRDLPIGKKDDTGKLTAVSGAVFDEAKGTYMNPFDGVVKNVKSWTYDYTTRAYTLTLADGTTILLTYGDDNVTIVEGGKTYTFYYLIPAAVTPSPSPSSSPSACLHDYVPTVTTAATCLTPGLKTFNCSKCKDSYTQQISATGHTWVVKETVNTTYDATGALVKQGYTIFKCSVCGEEYKDVNGGGPPGGGGGSSSGNSIWDKLGALLGSAANGFIAVLQTAVVKILDALVSMFDAINTKLASVTTAIFGLFERIPKLFGGFTGFLAAVFPFFPPEVFDILTLSMLILAAGALIRFFLKR